MAGRLMEMIERLTERKVLTYQSQVLFEPDVVVEIFLFDSEGAGTGTVKSTAEGQLAADDTGEAMDHDALDAASSAGQSRPRTG